MKNNLKESATFSSFDQNYTKAASKLDQLKSLQEKYSQKSFDRPIPSDSIISIDTKYFTESAKTLSDKKANYEHFHLLNKKYSKDSRINDLRLYMNSLSTPEAICAKNEPHVINEKPTKIFRPIIPLAISQKKPFYSKFWTSFKQTVKNTFSFTRNLFN